MIWDELPQNCGIWNGQIAIDTDLVERVISRGRALERVAAAAKDLIDPNDCRSDHNQFCQEHGSSDPCVQRVAREALAELEKGVKEGGI